MIQEITDLKAEIKTKDDMIFHLKSKEGELRVKDELIDQLKYNVDNLKLSRAASLPVEDSSFH